MVLFEVVLLYRPCSTMPASRAASGRACTGAGRLLAWLAPSAPFPAGSWAAQPPAKFSALHLHHQIITAAAAPLLLLSRSCSEGGIWATLFGLLLWEVLFMPVPDVFRTPFQVGASSARSMPPTCMLAVCLNWHCVLSTPQASCCLPACLPACLPPCVRSHTYVRPPIPCLQTAPLDLDTADFYASRGVGRLAS